MNKIEQEIKDRGLRVENVNLDNCEICNECATVLLPDVLLFIA